MDTPLTKKQLKMLENRIRRGLLDQLDPESGSHHIDLVADYMELWNTKNLLQADIRGRGVRITGFTARGDPADKKNESVDQLLKVNAQMLKILQELGVKVRLKPVGEDDAL